MSMKIYLNLPIDNYRYINFRSEYLYKFWILQNHENTVKHNLFFYIETFTYV